MTEEAYQRHLAHRRALIAEFVAEPHEYKVCASCSSIAPNYVGICSFCASYCWEHNPLIVLIVARTMGSHAFPRLSGVVPRLPPDPLPCAVPAPLKRTE